MPPSDTPTSPTPAAPAVAAAAVVLLPDESVKNADGTVDPAQASYGVVVSADPLRVVRLGQAADYGLTVTPV